jgi:hypothetical protein
LITSMLLAIPTPPLRGAPAAPALGRSLAPPRRRCSGPAQTSASTAIVRVIRALVPITLLLAAAIVGCAGDSEGSSADAKPQVETTDAGTRTIAVTDEQAGLRIEVHTLRQARGHDRERRPPR